MTGFKPKSALLISALCLAGCAQPVTDVFLNGGPVADARGVLVYDGFTMLVARDDDSIEAMAGRVGLSAPVLARYNGLPLDYKLRPGERLALPDAAQVAAVEQGWLPEARAGDLASLPGIVEGNIPEDAPGVQLARHVVAEGETLAQIATRYNVSVTALARWNGLGKDLVITPGRSLVIPPAGASSEPPTSQPGEGTVITPPPSAADALPEDVPPVQIPEGPDLSEPQVTGSAGLFTKPVKGTIVLGYSVAPGAARNEGVDYETAKGAEVRAAASGEVALVSEALGEKGKIILLRHRDDYITIYGRVDGLKVKKGDKVRAGQVIATVADATPPLFHFEVRKGRESLDPGKFISE